MKPRDAAHYRDMMARNPRATVGYQLAARAVAAAKDGPGTEPTRQDMLRLKDKHGDALELRSVLDEMACAEMRGIRERLGWPQSRFAQALGVQSTTVSRWERGERRPGEPTLRLARGLEAAPGGTP